MHSKLNVILIVLIAVVLGVIAFFGWRLWNEPEPSVVRVENGGEQPSFVDTRPPKERDMAMQADMRKIESAVHAWAQDHNGAYPESDVKNPCSGVRYCLKGIHMRSGEKTYLSPIPQTIPYHLDYHYRADNKARTFCIKTPVALETEEGKLFQCTREGCGSVPFAEACG